MWRRALSSRACVSAFGMVCTTQNLNLVRCDSDAKDARSGRPCDVSQHDRKRWDVLVLGGGIAGISTALFLAQSGRSVLVSEAHAVGGGATGMSCATIQSVGVGDCSNITHSMTNCTLNTLREFQQQATAGKEHLNCGFVECGSLVLVSSERELQKASADVKELHRHGYDAHLLTTSEARQLEPALKDSLGLLGALHMPQSGYADPGMTMQALQSAAEDAGAVIWEGWKTIAASPDTTDSCDHAWIVDLACTSKDSSSFERVSCNHVVLATGASAYETGKIFGLEVPVARVKAQMWSAKSRSREVLRLPHIIYALSSHLFWQETSTTDELSGTPNLVTHSKVGQRYCHHVYGRPCSDNSQEVLFGGDRIPLSLHEDPSDYQPNEVALRENFTHISGLLPSLELQLADMGALCGVVGNSLHGGYLVGEASCLPNLWLCTGFGGSGFMKGVGAGKAIADWIGGESESAKSIFACKQIVELTRSSA